MGVACGNLRAASRVADSHGLFSRSCRRFACLYGNFQEVMVPVQPYEFVKCLHLVKDLTKTTFILPVSRIALWHGASPAWHAVAPRKRGHGGATGKEE